MNRIESLLSALTFTTLLALVAAVLLLSGCGGGGGGDGAANPPAAQTATFAFRIQGRGAEEEFRYATSDRAFIEKARAQLSLPVTGRGLFPAGEITGGDGGVNTGRGWHFTSMDLVESAIALCNVPPSYIEMDLPNWLRSVHSLCPWNGYVYAEVTGSYAVRGLAIGQPQSIAPAGLRVELRDVVDSRCPAAAICITAGEARVDLLVHRGDSESQALTLRLDAAAPGASQGDAFGHRFTLEALTPYPVSGPAPKEQYRAQLSVRKL
jgi:hypothetical protein